MLSCLIRAKVSLPPIQASQHDLIPSFISLNHPAKRFSRSLASFALVPSPQTRSLTSNVMVVNKEGDLELYAIHDTPKQVIWSARGDFGVGTGHGLRIVSGFNEDSPPPEPWDIQTPTPHPHLTTVSSSSRSRSRQPREASAARGRSKPSSIAPPAPPFGRGDDDGFPALNRSLSALGMADSAITRSSKERTYSPASLRNYNYRFGPRETQSRFVQGSRHVNSETSRGRSRRSNDQNDSRPRKQSLNTITLIAEGDISMAMRQRVIRGYGLGKVRFCHS
jgi:hypothetical protein